MVSLAGRGQDRGGAIRRSALAAGEEGALSVYFLLAGAALLVLFLAILNYGRFLLADRQGTQALEAAAASILSYYEPELTREMGLFALDSQNSSLEDTGRSYFQANLGRAGALNGQEVLSFSLVFPEASRLGHVHILEAQALDLQRIEGWTGIAQDLLDFLGAADWRGLLFQQSGGDQMAEALGLPQVETGGAASDAGAGPGAGAADAGMGARVGAGVSTGDVAGPVGRETGAAGAASPPWLRELESDLEEGGDAGGAKKIKLWHFLLPWPPDKSIADVNLPAEIAAAARADRYRLDDYTELWQDLIFTPAQAVREEGYITGVWDQLKDFLSDFQAALNRAVTRGKNKILFTEYLISELDFATNKPVQKRYFSRGEVEYVVCGEANSWDNLRGVALRLLLLRTGIHVLKAAVDMEIVDEITLAKAILNGVVKGGDEVEQLFAGQRIPAIPGQTRLTLSYKDHLRLLLLCQSELRQIQALRRLTQVNLWHWARGAGAEGQGPAAGAPGSVAGFDLSRYAAEVEISVESRLSLWPFGSVRLQKKGVMGYDRPFALLAAE